MSSMDARERRFRDEAVKPVYRRIEADCRRFPRIAPYLRTIGERLFDPTFDIASMWRDNGVRTTSASQWFAPLGMPPKAYFDDCRLSVAGRLLDHTRLHVHRIPALVGYSPQGFFKAFKKWSGGRTPLEYRKSPDKDPEPWCPVADPAKLQAAVEGRFNRREGLKLCHRFHEFLLDSFVYDMRDLLAFVDRAVVAADYEAAQRYLDRAAQHPERDAYQVEIDSRLAVVTHCRGTFRTQEGDVDRAYEDLNLARTCYAQAGALEPSLEKRRRRLEIQVPCSTDQALTSALCPDCRRAFVLDVGESLRGHLRRALELVPLDLPWFRVCCDPCYRVMWEAFKYARHGQLEDAWRAFWLARNVDLEDPDAPASMGRVIAALSEVDSFGWSSQEDRLKLCEKALGAAEGVGRPELLLVARLWRGVVRCALADYSGARSDIRWSSTDNPTIKVLYDRFMGVLEQATTHYEKALLHLDSARLAYQEIDPHVAGLLLAQQARVYVDQHDYLPGIDLFRQAMTLFDDRRGAGPPRSGVPVDLATALALSGDPDQAEAELKEFQYDRKAYPLFAAVEVFTGGCVAIMRGNAQRALQSFEKAQIQFEEIDQMKNAALTATYSVEAYHELGERDRAAAAALNAGRYFAKVGCSRETLAALTRLHSLLAEGASTGQIATIVRRLAALNGGWLPEVRPD